MRNQIFIIGTGIRNTCTVTITNVSMHIYTMGD